MKKLLNVFFFVLVVAATMAFTKKQSCGNVFYGTPWPNQNAYNCINEYTNLEPADPGPLALYTLTRRISNTIVLKSDLAPGQTIVSYINDNGGRPEFECKWTTFNDCF